MYPVKWSLKALLLFLIFQFSTSIDTITPNYSLKDGDVLVSSGQIFTLGFFSPGNSKYRYVGIWYSQVPEQTVVWVANRNNPINDTSGVLAINGLGNLVLYEKNQTVPLWSTNVSVTAASNTMAELLDSGNLVLVHNDTKRVSLWQSFDYPTDTVLPYMKIGLDRRTGLNRFTTSWRSQDDPGTGNFSCRIDPSGFPQLYLYKSSDPWWRAGSWTGQRWSGVPRMTHKDLFNSSYVNDQNETSIMWWSVTTNASILSRMVIYESGLVQRFTWNDQDRRWIGFWSEPSEPCNYYGHCGANSNCDPYIEDKFECTCLPGFEPNSPQEWFLRDGSGGCVRKSGVSTCKSGEGFVKVARVKVPDTSMASVNMSLGLKACEEECLRNCSCMAYGSAYEGNKGGTGCLTWHANLVDTRTYSNSGQDLFVRVDAVELAHYANNGSLGKKGLTKILIPSIVAIIIMVTFVYWLVKKRREERGHSKHSFSFTPSSPYFEDSPSRMELDGNKKKLDLPLFDLSTIAAATDNFSPDNKLGEGGFGPVYKGVLSNGREIAVKRLSKYSGQGIGEFKNEIALIARLQHRNLVRILGCCIDKEEKMLLYEYLPNQSLDSFIFGETKRPMLNWRKRFEIICGVARGILYLHHDSRLRIIHRDLKASNVLLDAAMDPKISDFGMAKIFGGDQVQANTNRVVGTYGYMSPEYAMEGIFSIKSDVYSFGVLLLEIITGRKISGDYPDSPTSNLVGHVWNLWREGKVMEIIDSSLGESYLANEVLRCIHIGLLCVQEHATDRPTMSTIVSMLGNDTVLPSPRQPAFIIRSGGGTTGTSSVNDVTITVVQGR